MGHGKICIKDCALWINDSNLWLFGSWGDMRDSLRMAFVNTRSIRHRLLRWALKHFDKVITAFTVLHCVFRTSNVIHSCLRGMWQLGKEITAINMNHELKTKHFGTLKWIKSLICFLLDVDCKLLHLSPYFILRGSVVGHAILQSVCWRLDIKGAFFFPWMMPRWRSRAQPNLLLRAKKTWPPSWLTKLQSNLNKHDMDGL